MSVSAETRIKEITDLMASPSPEDIALITKAYLFAEKAHKDHKRFSGEPYFEHLFQTAKELAKTGMGPRTIATGFLHDSIEDVGISRETIRTEFGPDILFLVEGVTKLGQLKYKGAERHTESLRKLFVATSQDLRVLIIKLMDRLHNMRTLKYVPERKRKRIAEETIEIFAPLAHRLGMGLVRRELEDLAFPYVNPEEHKKTQELLKQKSKALLADLEALNKSLKREMGLAGITNLRTDFRVKGLYSLFRKLKRKGDIEKIYDVSALRVIVGTVGECYQTLGIIHAHWRPLPGKIKDYIAFPKPNGYQSLHTTVFTGKGSIVEIQIRTEQMHQEAEYGIASHVLYKQDTEGKKVSHGKQTNFEWLRQLLPRISPIAPRGAKQTPTASSGIAAPEWVRSLGENEDTEGNEYIDSLKGDFFNHRVFVFTPKGDVVDLPVNSSPIDFAYAIHSDIGDHMAGVKVNGKMVTLETTLHNGDIVEIQTRNSARPTAKWLELVKTTLAARHIRNALAKQKHR